MTLLVRTVVITWWVERIRRSTLPRWCSAKWILYPVIVRRRLQIDRLVIIRWSIQSVGWWIFASFLNEVVMFCVDASRTRIANTLLIFTFDRDHWNDLVLIFHISKPPPNPHTDHNTDNGKPFENPFGVTDQYVSRLIVQIKTYRQKCRGYPYSTLVLTLTTGGFGD